MNNIMSSFNTMNHVKGMAIYWLLVGCCTSIGSELVSFSCSARLMARLMAAPRPWMVSSLCL